MNILDQIRMVSIYMSGYVGSLFLRELLWRIRQGLHSRTAIRQLMEFQSDGVSTLDLRCTLLVCIFIGALRRQAFEMEECYSMAWFRSYSTIT